MASILKVDEMQGVTSAGDITITDGTTTMKMQVGIAKFYALFELDSTQAITDSFNAASITDDGTGKSELGFTSNMANATYIVTSNGVHDGGSYVGGTVVNHDSPPASSSVHMDFLKYGSEAAHDGELCCATIHGDLA